MSYVLVRHTVKDYKQWKKAFDEHRPACEAYGLGEARILCSHEDPNEIVLLVEAQDIRQAQQFMESPELKEFMNRAGVSDKPDIFYLDELSRVPKHAAAPTGATTKAM